MGRVRTTIVLAALGAVATGCARQASSGGEDVLGSVRGGDTELVVTWHAPLARMFLRTSTGTSLAFPLLARADVDRALELIEAGAHAPPPEPAAGEVVLARMNAGRPEARVVVAPGQPAALVISSRADAEPAPAFSIRLTPESADAIEAVLRRARDRLAR